MLCKVAPKSCQILSDRLQVTFKLELAETQCIRLKISSVDLSVPSILTPGFDSQHTIYAFFNYYS